MRWNDKTNEYAYKFVKEDAVTMGGMNEGALENEYLNDLIGKGTSKAYQIKLAYYRGQLRGIRIADDMKNKIYPSKEDTVPTHKMLPYEVRLKDDEFSGGIYSTEGGGLVLTIKPKKDLRIGAYMLFCNALLRAFLNESEVDDEITE